MQITFPTFIALLLGTLLILLTAYAVLRNFSTVLDNAFLRGALKTLVSFVAFILLLSLLYFTWFTYGSSAL